MASGMDGSAIGAIVDKVTFVNKVGLETNFIYSPLVIFYFYLHYSHCLDEIGRKFLSCGAPLRWHSSQTQNQNWRCCHFQLFSGVQKSGDVVPVFICLNIVGSIPSPTDLL